MFYLYLFQLAHHLVVKTSRFGICAICDGFAVHCVIW